MSLSPTQEEPPDEDIRSTGPIIVPVPVITRETRIVPVMPVSVTPPAHPRVSREQPERGTPEPEVEPHKTVPTQEPRPLPVQKPEVPESTGPPVLKVPESTEIGPKAGTQPVPSIPAYKTKGKDGRKRKYDEKGLHGEASIREVVLFRHRNQRWWADVSDDMRYWYDWMYFTQPEVGEKSFKGRDYEQHKRAYERGQQWIAAWEAARTDSHTQAKNAVSGPVGHSGATITPFPRRANG